MGRQQRSIHHDSRGMVPAHRVNGDLRHTRKKNALALGDFEHGAAAVITALGTGAVR
jgi:hypothetical protein